MAERMFGMNRSFISEVTPPPGLSGPVWWFVFHRNRLLVRVTDGCGLAVPSAERVEELGVSATQQHYLGRYEGRACYALDVAEGTAPGGMDFKDLRQVYAGLDEDLFVLAGRAVQIVEWDRTHQYCGRCGGKTYTRDNERAKACPECKLMNFPRLSPAVIMAVERGNELLLARSSRFPSGLYSVLAGFVEPGETIEECVVREVREEVGVSVGNVRYVASQPWPFPNSLMLGFSAEYRSGEITPDPVEIAAAGWFTADALPSIPGRISIARRLIDRFVAKQTRQA